MKYRALFSATALMSTSMMMITPALATATGTPTAAAADSTTLAGMQSQCNALAAAHDLANGDIWTGVVVAGAVTQVAGPTETGNRVVDHSSIQGTGIYVPAQLEIRGDPFKNGGSVNLFGDQWSTAGYYPDSTYNYTADFSSTFSHAFTCNINDAVYHAAYDDPAVPVQGYYEVDIDAPGDSTTNRNNCNAFTALGDNVPLPDFWGTHHAFCHFIKTADAIPAVHHNAYNSPPVFVANEAGTSINQDQSDNLSGFEEHGGVLPVTAEFHVGQPVICISPGSKGGAWRTQNGYGGGNLTGPAAGCNTPYFKIAPTYHGSTTSNGTFTSVPNYN